VLSADRLTEGEATNYELMFDTLTHPYDNANALARFSRGHRKTAGDRWSRVEGDGNQTIKTRPTPPRST
jgi:hypothetical protein